jgi:hypothetical protein
VPADLSTSSSLAAYGGHSDNPVGDDRGWPVRPPARLCCAQEKAELESDASERLGLAMMATIRSIDAIRLSFPLRWFAPRQGASIYAATLCCGLPIIRSQAGRDTEDGDDLIWAERSRGQGEQH